MLLVYFSGRGKKKNIELQARGIVGLFSNLKHLSARVFVRHGAAVDSERQEAVCWTLLSAV